MSSSTTTTSSNATASASPVSLKLAINPPSQQLTARFAAAAGQGAFTNGVPKPNVNEQVNILITGATRGLGLELVRQYASSNPSSVVFAGARDVKSSTLVSLQSQYPNIEIVLLDVEDDSSIHSAFKFIQSKVKYLNVVINNAGVLPYSTGPLVATREQFTKTFNINVFSVAIVTQVFLPLLKEAASSKFNRNPRVINISSFLGSTALVPSIFANIVEVALSAPYFASKAALNNLTVQFAVAVPDVHFSAVNPGWIKTDMGSEMAPLNKEDAIQALRALIQSRTKENSGQFVDNVNQGDYLPL